MPRQQQVCPKPLSDKVFYLDLPSSRRAESLEDDIKLLGGTVEKFFSKEIGYLVSNKREAKYVEHLRREMGAPSPVSGQSSPLPHRGANQPAGSHKDRLKPGSPGQADSQVATSRGKSLLERVVKEQERIQMDKTLLNALEWGVKVLYIDDIITYVEKRKKPVVPSPPVARPPVKKRMKPESKPRPNFPKSQAHRITGPFIKVEDSSRHYRPLYAAMSKMPELNTETAPPCTPFCADKKDQNRKGHSEERGHGKTNRDKKQAGFCECCMLQYDNLSKHVQSESHLAFSKGNEYLVLDRLISTMQCDLALLKPKTKRPKCSVSSTLAVPGPHGRELHKPQVASVTEERLKPDRISTAAGGREPLNGLTAEPPAGSVQTSGANGILRNPDRTSAQPLPRHTPHTGGTDSVGDPTAGAGPLVQTPALQVELAPSSGSAAAPDPATLCRRHTEDSQRGCSPRTPRSLQEGGGEGDRDCPRECHRQNAPAPGERETGVPVSQGVHAHEDLPSPVTRIQRKVRVQKRKRQRVDTGLAVHGQVRATCDVPDYSLLYLWQLSHSSDHTDVE